MKDENSNVLRIAPSGAQDEPTEAEIAVWRDNARRSPDWAARQIWALLRRALAAEAEAARLRDG